VTVDVGAAAPYLTAAMRMPDETTPRLIRHADAGLNAEARTHDLNDPITPADRVFIRSNGATHGVDLDPARWTLRVDGEVERALAFSVIDLQTSFDTVSVSTVMECAGNGRAMFSPRTDGIQWGHGAVACLTFEGVRVGDVLRAAGLRPSAVYTGHISPDVTASGAPALSRGLPIAKALAPETLIAFRMNGEPLPAMNGGPLRVVAPGFPGSAWQKWLSRIWVRDREHDGARMTGLDYRLPRTALTPGASYDAAGFEIITQMPPRALITSHAQGQRIDRSDSVMLEGWAWGHGTPVAQVDVMLDEAAWVEAELGPEPTSPYAWRRFRAKVRLPSRGAPQVVAMARATLANGQAQPLESAMWNPKGYCNNACQRLVLSLD
jgi:sulfite oxidase